MTKIDRLLRCTTLLVLLLILYVLAPFPARYEYISYYISTSKMKSLSDSASTFPVPSGWEPIAFAPPNQGNVVLRRRKW